MESQSVVLWNLDTSEQNKNKMLENELVALLAGHLSKKNKTKKQR